MHSTNARPPTVTTMTWRNISAGTRWQFPSAKMWNAPFCRFTRCHANKTLVVFEIVFFPDFDKTKNVFLCHWFCFEKVGQKIFYASLLRFSYAPSGCKEWFKVFRKFVADTTWPKCLINTDCCVVGWRVKRRTIAEVFEKCQCIKGFVDRRANALKTLLTHWKRCWPDTHSIVIQTSSILLYCMTHVLEDFTRTSRKVTSFNFLVPRKLLILVNRSRGFGHKSFPQKNSRFRRLKCLRPFHLQVTGESSSAFAKRNVKMMQQKPPKRKKIKLLAVSVLWHVLTRANRALRCVRNVYARNEVRLLRFFFCTS